VKTVKMTAKLIPSRPLPGGDKPGR